MAKIRHKHRGQVPPPMVPEEQYGPWKGMRPPHTHPSAVPADRYQRPRARNVPFRDVLSGFPSAIVFLVGVWLLVGQFLIDHPGTAAGISSVWNDVGVGALLVLLGSARAVVPFSTMWAGWLTLPLGGWLIAAPFVLGYQQNGDTAAAIGNDIVCGALVVVLTALSLGWTMRSRRP
ncbi:SPW repeat-containing protein [Prauserella shujinwangii]|uniref:SPW repeat-containing protein n=1 Tax=Prauserella shujinwangii TaxID=1453103 RepID=A0A2T0LL57_9PSEU|nr:SPW repeat protein [Prauserella shujinwangii]PRX43691.1 SPW repeat-containing protein [Prauserella shujinwangii]